MNVFMLASVCLCVHFIVGGCMFVCTCFMLVGVGLCVYVLCRFVCACFMYICVCMFYVCLCVHVFMYMCA